MAWIADVAGQYCDRGVRFDGVKPQQSAVMRLGDLRPTPNACQAFHGSHGHLRALGANTGNNATIW
jgi:hypothetical protein